MSKAKNVQLCLGKPGTDWAINFSPLFRDYRAEQVSET